MHYQLHSPLQQQHIQQLYHGLGSQTHSGMGQIVPMDAQWHPLLQQQQLELQHYQPNTNHKTEKIDNSPLVRFLRQQLDQDKQNEQLNNSINKAIEKIKQHYQSVSNFSGESEVGPGKTQWNNLSSRINQNPQQWQSLFQEIVSPDDESWGQKDNKQSFAQLLQQLLEQQNNKAQFIIRLAKKMATQVEAIQKGEAA